MDKQDELFRAVAKGAAAFAALVAPEPALARSQGNSAIAAPLDASATASA